MFENILIGFSAFADPLVLVGLIVGALLGYMLSLIHI